MRWGSLLATLFMGGASVFAPRLLSSATGIDPQGLMAMASQMKSVGSGGAMDDKASRQWQALQSGEVDSIPLEQLAALADAQSREAVSKNPEDMASAIVKAFHSQQPLGEQWRAGVLRDAEPARRYYLSRRRAFQTGFLLAGAALIAVAFLGALPPLRGTARFLFGMVFGLSGKLLILLSLAATAFFAASALNPWPLIPPELLGAPVAYMLLCGLFLRVVDINYPVWNRMLWSFGAPVAAALGMLGWTKFKPEASA
ncbi:MAG: hypothetical protein HY077_17670 [Elusimicrobia bacterium]|nr:hypothetical protein [Elusimicrobiota bacterium]